jgi:hypothetical protein
MVVGEKKKKKKRGGAYTRNGIGRLSSEQIKDNTGVAGFVELLNAEAIRLFCSAACHGEIVAERVILGTVWLTGGVQGDNLMAKDVVSGSDGGGDLDIPSQVVLDQLIGCPVVFGRV